MYISFSIASLIFPVLVGALFTWLDGKIIFSEWMIDYLYGHYQDQYYIILICSIVYLLLLITGIVFGSISLNIGLKALSILGLIANIILIIIIIFRAFIFFMVYFIFD